MTQQPTQFCTECGTPGPLDQRFCSNCGSAMKTNSNDPTRSASNILQASVPTMAAPGPFTAEATIPNTGQRDPYLTREQDNTPPPPPPISGTYNPYTTSTPGGPQAYEQQASPSTGYNTPAPGMYNPPVPAYAQARKSHGCLITSILLLLVVVVGIGGFIFLEMPFAHSQANNGNPVTNGTTNPGGTTNGTITSTIGAHTVQLNLKLTYASIQTTIVSIQSASSFPDDPSGTGQANIVLVRLNLHEVNSSTGNPDYLESDVLRLTLANGTSVQSTNQQQNISPNTGISRDNWIDFLLDHTVRLDQLTLRLGTPSQHQMDVPLKAAANLSAYQDKTRNPNLQFQYNGLDWTLKSATRSYSYNDKQATTGNLYIIITFAVVNHTTSDAAIFPNDFMRLQAGSSTQAPDSYVFPYSTPSQGTNGGVVGFLMPQDATSFTLIMLGNTSVSPPVAQITQTFQI